MTCTQRAATTSGRAVKCSLDAQHVLAGEHHFALDGLVEWPGYSDDTEPVRITGHRAALAVALIGSAAAPGGQLA